MLVSIPQAVGTVATTLNLRKFFVYGIEVSIPQAVGTVATVKKAMAFKSYVAGFNTASGRYCCNLEVIA